MNRDSQTTVMSFGSACIDEDQIFGYESGFHIMFVPSHTAHAFSKTVFLATSVCTAQPPHL